MTALARGRIVSHKHSALLNQIIKRKEIIMDNTYIGLQSRLAVVEERNRANKEQRDKLLAKIKEEHGCKNLEELRAKQVTTQEELTKSSTKLEDARLVATTAVEGVEQALAGGE